MGLDRILGMHDVLEKYKSSKCSSGASQKEICFLRLYNKIVCYGWCK